jgi:hypothetical protein
MFRQGALYLLIVGSLTTCNWLTPPCTKAARAVCDIGREGDACAFLLNRESSDQHSQDVCREILPAAKALGEDSRSPANQAAWDEARRSLADLGLQRDPSRGNIATKLVNAGGLPGKLVTDLKENSRAAEENTAAAVQRALDSAAK